MSPISLEELNQRASLLTRIDRKYILPVAELPVLLDELSTKVRVLTIGGSSQFGYRSTYFDSSTLNCYLDAARRRRKRFKVRVRTYLDSGERFLEVKTHGNRGRTVKQRTPYSGEEHHLSAPARIYSQDVLADNGIRCDLSDFRAVLTTDYQRMTLFDPASSSRITIDTGLAWTVSRVGNIGLPGLAIVETKSPQAIAETDRLLWSLRHRPRSISKYATGLAALRPDLPSHHWRPILRRHFLSSEK